ncbi:ATP-binding protein, partial [Candidatus Micrarchaeota archaeon]|nr:ATP-binding protein [Candidatus Micrarchaeota archaeon]
MKNEIEDLVDKLRPILGSKVDRLLLASRVTDPASAQIYRSAILALAAKHLGNLDEKILLPPPTKEQATSEYQPLGTVVYNGLELFPFGLHESEWTSHTAVLGRSGSGKTNAVRILLQSLHEKGKPYLVVDWKQDYFPSDALWVTAGHDLEFNPLVPPVPLTGDAYRDYLKGVVELFVQAYFRDMQLLTVEGLRNLLLEKLDALCTKHGTYTGSGTYPTFRAIQDEIQTTKSKVIAYARDSLLSVLQAIGFGTTNRVFNTTRSLDISKLLENNVVLKLHSLGSTADKAFLCMSLVNSIYTYRLQQPSPEFKHAIIAEEYHNMDSPYMRYVFRMIRSLGEAIVLCDQHPSKLTVETLGNTYSVICFNLRHQADVQAASRAMLLPQDQWDALGRLEVGQAIVKLQGRY